MSQKSVIVAIVCEHKSSGNTVYRLDGDHHPNKEVWGSLKDFCKEYGLVYNTLVRKDFPFEFQTCDKYGNTFLWLVDRCDIHRL